MWDKISNEDVGGFSSSKWLIGCGKGKASGEYPNLLDLCVTAGMKRRFIDVLKLAVRDRVCDPPDKKMPKPITMYMVTSGEKFTVPSVFSRTGWVNRSLTPYERGAIFDIPELLISELE